MLGLDEYLVLQNKLTKVIVRNGYYNTCPSLCKTTLLLLTYTKKGIELIMKTKLSVDYTSPAILVVTALGIFIGSPVLLGIGFLGFCLNSVLDKALLSSMEAGSYIQDLEIRLLEAQLEAKKSNE